MLFGTDRTVKQLASIDKSLEAQNDSYKWQNAPSDCARLFAPMMGPVASATMAQNGAKSMAYTVLAWNPALRFAITLHS